MNLPNKLTVLRTAMVPFFLVFLLIDAIPNNYLWACIIFAVASFTDFLDGNIARKHNLVTNFGKFLDPLADKILVTCAIVAFVTLGL
ncbi:MAG: CDP-alcohol phosphatidyltransferase family protein, partial [Oscillospiraceae bacterium]